MRRASWLVVVAPLLAACSSSPPPATPAENLKRIDGALRTFVADANGGRPAVAQAEAQLDARLDDESVRLLAQQLVTLFEARAGDPQARAALRTQAASAAAKFHDLPYLRDLPATVPAAATVTNRLRLDPCAGFTFDCRASCVDDAAGAATNGLGLEGLKGVIDEVTGLPLSLAASGADLAAFLGTCAGGGPCDRATFLRLARDVSLGLLVVVGGTAAVLADAPLLALVIALEATGLAVANIVVDEGARLQCCSDYQLQHCLGKCPAPNQVCRFPENASGTTTAPGAACCAPNACWACFFEVASQCPLASFCGDLCCGSGMVCPGDLQMCVAPEDGGAPDGGAPDSGPHDGGADAAGPGPDDGAPGGDAGSGADGGSNVCCCDFRTADYNWHCTNSSRTGSGVLCNVPWPDCCAVDYTICE